MLFSFGRARRSDPETSQETAALVRVAASRLAVLKELKGSPVGLCDFELEARLAGRFSPERVRTARHELTEQGVVQFAESFRMTRRGRRARVWIAKRGV